MSPKIGIGIVTFNRPHFFTQAVQGVLNELSEVADYISVYNDGSDATAYFDAYNALPIDVELTHSSVNQGVAKAKNTLLQKMLEKNCDHLFLMEDDLIPITPNAVHRYIEAAQLTGYEHLNFAHHGPGNKSGPVREENGIAYYASISGAWSFYTRHAIETVGFMDENFYNAWEHMEHTWRIAKAGLTSPFWQFADVKGSRNFFQEIGDRENLAQYSVIRNMNGWLDNVETGKEYWRSKDPDCPV